MTTPFLTSPSRIRRLVLVGVAITLALMLIAARTAQATPYEGVMLHSMWSQVSDADMQHELDLAANAHANLVRIDVGWSSLEGTGRGQYAAYWVSKLDRFMSAAAARGLKVLPVAFSTPCWASTAPDSLKQGCAGDWWNRRVNLYPPSDPSDYGHFVAWLVSRYGADLAAVELWNEPDADGQQFWASANPAADYATLVKATYPLAKAANPRVPVLAASLSGVDVSFLSQLYANGIRGSYDGLALHPYNGSLAPGAIGSPGSDRFVMAGGFAALRSLRAAAGDTTPLWATEFGWTTASGLPESVDPAAQASYLGAGVRWFRDQPDVAADIVFELRAMGDDSTNDGFALVNGNFSPRPAYAAVQAAMATRPAGAAGQPTGVTVASAVPRRSLRRHRRSPRLAHAARHGHRRHGPRRGRHARSAAGQRK